MSPAEARPGGRRRAAGGRRGGGGRALALSVSLLPLSFPALRSRRSGVLGSTPRRSRPAASHSPLWKLLSGHFVFQRSSGGSEFPSGPCFWSRLCGFPATSLGVLCHLRRSLGAGCPGDPADLDARGWAEGARTRIRCPGPSRSSAKHALWDSRQLPLISLIGWELGYR